MCMVGSLDVEAAPQRFKGSAIYYLLYFSVSCRNKVQRDLTFLTRMPLQPFHKIQQPTRINNPPERGRWSASGKMLPTTLPAKTPMVPARDKAPTTASHTG